MRVGAIFVFGVICFVGGYVARDVDCAVEKSVLRNNAEGWKSVSKEWEATAGLWEQVAKESQEAARQAQRIARKALEIRHE